MSGAPAHAAERVPQLELPEKCYGQPLEPRKAGAAAVQIEKLAALKEELATKHLVVNAGLKEPYNTHREPVPKRTSPAYLNGACET